MWQKILDWLEPWTTENIIAQLVAWDLMHNIYFIGGVVALALILYFLRQRFLTAMVVMLAGLATVMSYTFGYESATEGISGDRLFVFIGVSVVFLALAIYLLFIRNE